MIMSRYNVIIAMKFEQPVEGILSARFFLITFQIVEECTTILI